MAKIGFTAPEVGIGHNEGPDYYGDDEEDHVEEKEIARRLAQVTQLSTKEILQLAHKKLLGTLLLRLEAGTISPPEMATLRNLLRDNGEILGSRPDGGEDRPRPEDRPPLPQYEPPDYEGDD